MKTLNEQLWAVAKEYARQFGEIIQMEPEHWVGDCPDMCCFGDCYFFTLEEIRQVVDDIDKYRTRYGSTEAVGEEIRDWVDWWLDGCAPDRMCRVEQRVTREIHPNINLKSWLDGCLREDREPWSGPDADYLRLQNDHETIERLLKDYGPDNTLANIFIDLDQDLQKATEAKARRDFEQWQELMKGKSGQQFADALKCAEQDENGNQNENDEKGISKRAD